MKLKFKKTPILFLSILLIPLSVIGTINFLFFDNKGGMSLAGVLLLGVLIFNLVILLIEQVILINFVNLKKVWILELTLIILIILFSIIFSD